MISVILYGRNDAHGYNLHRRAALSLNCIAEVLTDDDDELIFVDYNTPDELPTFIEAISDTLTERCLDRLRVLRVAAAIHDQRFAARTHLPAIEPVARNVAARRANPSNRWLLSTNTDMIIVPLRGQSLSEICRHLADGFYGLPRFELPEWLWESLPRSDPRRAVAEIGRLGPQIRLDEPTVSHDWIRFDAPGDFQLMLRDDFVAIDGFDEEMLLGYHVDSNLSRRLLLHRGSIETLEAEASGYHCNHNRTRTVYHGTVVTNDLEKFFYSVDQAGLPAQRSTWGLPDVTVEEVPIRHGVGTRAAAVLSDLVPAGMRSSSDAFGNPYSLTYDSGHVAAYVVDTLVVAPLDAKIGYIGANFVLERILDAAVTRLGFEHRLAVARFADAPAVEEIAQNADVFIIDLGVDGADADAAVASAGAETDLSKLPEALVDALRALIQVILAERARYEQVKHLRTMMLVNSSAAFCDAYVRAQFDSSYTTIHSRVRRATVKPADEADTVALDRWLSQTYRLLRWSRRDEGAGCLKVRPGVSVHTAEMEDYAGFGDGWSHPEEGGIWTEGPESKLTIGLDHIDNDEHVLTLMMDMICVEHDDQLKVSVLANDEQLASREFRFTSVAFPWRIALPERLHREGQVELTVLVEEPRSPLNLGWSTDDRPLGIHIQTMTVEPVDCRVAIGEDVLFSAGSGGDRLLGDGWWPLESEGVWTAGDAARLNLQLTESVPTALELVMDAVPFLSPEHRTLDVELWADKHHIGTWTLRYGRSARPLRARLSGGMLDDERQARLDLRLRHPASPADLGLGNDTRRLGVYLRSLSVRQAPARAGRRDGRPSLRDLRDLVPRLRRDR